MTKLPPNPGPSPGSEPGTLEQLHETSAAERRLLFGLLASSPPRCASFWGCTREEPGRVQPSQWGRRAAWWASVLVWPPLWIGYGFEWMSGLFGGYPLMTLLAVYVTVLPVALAILLRRALRERP